VIKKSKFVSVLH